MRASAAGARASAAGAGATATWLRFLALTATGASSGFVLSVLADWWEAGPYHQLIGYAGYLLLSISTPATYAIGGRMRFARFWHSIPPRFPIPFSRPVDGGPTFTMLHTTAWVPLCRQPGTQRLWVQLMYSFLVVAPLARLCLEGGAVLPWSAGALLGLLAQVLMVLALFMYSPRVSASKMKTFFETSDAAKSANWCKLWVTMQLFLAFNVLALEQLQKNSLPGEFRTVVGTVVSVWVLAVSATLTHSVGGQWLYPQSWKHLNPFRGGWQHVSLQAAGWALISFAVIQIIRCGLSSLSCVVIPLTSGASGQVLSSGSVAGLVGEILLAWSLLVYKSPQQDNANESVKEPAVGWLERVVQVLVGTAGGSGVGLVLVLAASTWASTSLWPVLLRQLDQIMQLAQQSTLATAAVLAVMLAGRSLLNSALTDSSAPQYPAGSERRRNLDRLRAQSRQFPRPYPNGWYFVSESDELQEGVLQSVAMCGGRVELTREGSAIPSARWFDEQSSKSARGQPLRVQERLGMVLVWICADRQEPFFELTMLDELEDQAEFRFIDSKEWEPFQMHVMEPSQNSADWYHFQTVHQWLGQDASSHIPKALYVEHELKCQYGNCVNNKVSADEHTDLVPHELLIHEYVRGLKLFGFIPLPGFLATLLTTKVRMQGPTVIMFVIDNWLMGRFRAVFTLTPTEPFEQRARLSAFASRRWPWWLARVLMKIVMATVDQDRQVWEHKLAVAPRNLVYGDGPFLPYGKWLEQFYSPQSLDWDAVLARGGI